tara:strand:- start:601 stop:1797 length:1197 start_codon:yes stop_codon:yes gene_type:complete
MATHGTNASLSPSPHRPDHIKINNSNVWEHWKYPITVGNDTSVDDINFNSNEASEYAKLRMSEISPMTHEPFMLFEFLRVDNDNYGKATSDFVTGLGASAKKSWESQAIEGNTGKNNMWSGSVIQNYMAGTVREGPQNRYTRAETGDEKVSRIAQDTFDKVKTWAKSIGTLVKRKYMGSICLYMPTGIEINDQMVYNDDSRKMGAFAETLFSENYTDIFNPTTLTSPAALTAAGFVGGKILGGNGVMAALLGAGLGSVVSVELQRGSGKIANPNEIVMYNSTALRTFSFAWTILPDSAKESQQATGLIKMFRKAAHATKNNKMLITVPDHVVVSFHGAGAKGVEMIQLPPCVIESVNVSYNPNNTSFFKENNSPVEIGLAVTLKEMVPLYSDDVEAGY